MDKLSDARQRIDLIDENMARLFSERMEAAGTIAEYKAEHALPIFDAQREAEIIEKRSALVSDEIKEYYTDFLKSNMRLSRSYQAKLCSASENGFIYEDDGARSIVVRTSGSTSYRVTVARGAIANAGKYFDLKRRVLIVTDSGVPQDYARIVATQCDTPYVLTVPEGEASKSLESFGKILSTLADGGFTRTDCIVAVGGGVVGDLAGFAASAYMRGIDHYNIPTTLLSQIDSSIGGKTAIDLGGYKNIVGAFHQPRGVIIDPELLLTLDTRNVRAGLAEALKMACTSDAELFSLFESGEYMNDIENVILRSLLIKADIVERDPDERGERRILNFGHTVGHAIEALTGMLHGECVGIGMLFMCGRDVRERLVRILEDIGLPTHTDADPDALAEQIARDKKAHGDSITVAYVSEIGHAELITLPLKSINDIIKNGGIQ